MITDVIDRTAIEKALARTYDHRAYTDEWDAVREYREFTAYVARNPDAGRMKIGNALDIPPGRARTWKEGGMPDPARAVTTATDKGWLPSGGELPAQIQEAVAWIMASGSISEEYYVPHFVVPMNVETTAVRSLLADLSLRPRIEDRDTRSVEATPKEDASQLGRLLHVYGVPVGERITDIETLPPTLTAPPDEGQERAAARYLDLRGEYWSFTDEFVITHEDAPDTYLTDLAEWYGDIVGAGCEATESAVRIPTAPAESLLEPIDTHRL